GSSADPSPPVSERSTFHALGVGTLERRGRVPLSQRLRRADGGTPVWSFSPDCDLYASVVNTNRNFYATPTDKIDITSEFVLVFNKFGPMIAGETRALRATRAERTG